jgi:FdhD protein
MTLRDFSATKLDGTRVTKETVPVAVEEALQINVNNTPYTVTMRTPGHDDLLARGLLFTEKVVPDAHAPWKFTEIKNPESGQNVCINIYVPHEYVQKAVEGTRSLISSSSCGICGKKEIEDIRVEGPALKPNGRLHTGRLPSMVKQMEDGQTAFSRSGGCHAAAAFNTRGKLLAVYEDIGRHNAVDKVVGSLLGSGTIGEAHCLVVSGRVSYEIVAKAYNSQISYVAAISAASSLAVETAQECGMTILGFCRGDRATVYSNVENIEVGEEHV